MFKIKPTRKEDRYPCPVCGFNLKYPAEDFNICPSCGVEFGYETAGRSYADLRKEWVATGPAWASRVHPSPGGWNPWLQLICAGYEYIVPFRVYLHQQQASIPHGEAYVESSPMSVHFT
jgi:hypothetical protein